jgi:transposase
VVTAGQRHESVAFARVMEQGAVKRPGRGRPRQCPKRVVADKGYSNRKIRRYLRRRGIHYTTPRKRNERRTGPFDRQRYRARHRVARLITRLKPFRRVATRYETRAIDYTGMLTLATSLLWL